jgi:hypothetical protein
MTFGKKVFPCTAVLFAMLLEGCAPLAKKGLENPTQIHREGDLPSPIDPKNPEHLALQASRELYLRYYQKLEAAKTPTADQKAIDDYVNEGISLVEINCLRWFGRIAEAQRQIQFGDTNRNVITQLGTALIGVAKLNSDVTAVYGAGTTAAAGFSANTNSAFLAAPNTENVKRLTFDALKKRSDLMKDPSSDIYPKTFSSGYVELEKLADVCTYTEIKRLTTLSVDQSSASVNAQTGAVTVMPIATLVALSTENIIAKESLTCAIRNLMSNTDKENAEKALRMSGGSIAAQDDLQTLKDKLQNIVRNEGRTAEGIAKITQAFRSAGLNLNCK